MILALLAFVAAAATLFLSSRALIHRLIRLLPVDLLFFLLLPGTLLHELSHLLTAEILQVPTGHISLSPHLDKEQLRLGSAQIGLTDPIRLTLIGAAPFVTGTIALWLILVVGLGLNLSHLTLPVFNYWHILFYYLIFAISNTMFSSPSDLQAAALPIVLLLIILGLFQLTNLNIPVSLIGLTTNLFWLLALIFALVLILNLLLLLPLRLLRR
jgi:hypothetical protein